MEESLFDKIERNDFQCVAGPLQMCQQWIELKEKADLWVVVKRGENICHTAGKGGWRFTACTNEAEAQWLADLYNKERYSGEKVCTVSRLLVPNSN